MVNSNLAQVEEVFHLAMSYDREQRVAYLSRACEGNALLRCEVESLVAAYESGSDLLDESAVTLALRVIGSQADDSMAGREVGSYRIVSCLGRGGMGVVYEAEQEHPRRTVALKVIRPGMTTPELLQHWASHTARSMAEITRALRRIETLARFAPAEDSPAARWWRKVLEENLEA